MASHLQAFLSGIAVALLIANAAAVLPTFDAANEQSRPSGIVVGPAAPPQLPTQTTDEDDKPASGNKPQIPMNQQPYLAQGEPPGPRPGAPRMPPFISNQFPSQTRDLPNFGPPMPPFSLQSSEMGRSPPFMFPPVFGGHPHPAVQFDQMNRDALMRMGRNPEHLQMSFMPPMLMMQPGGPSQMPSFPPPPPGQFVGPMQLRDGPPRMLRLLHHGTFSNQPQHPGEMQMFGPMPPPQGQGVFGVDAGGFQPGGRMIGVSMPPGGQMIQFGHAQPNSGPMPMLYGPQPQPMMFAMGNHGFQGGQMGPPPPPMMDQSFPNSMGPMGPPLWQMSPSARLGFLQQPFPFALSRPVPQSSKFSADPFESEIASMMDQNGGSELQPSETGGLKFLRKRPQLRKMLIATWW